MYCTVYILKMHRCQVYLPFFFRSSELHAVPLGTLRMHLFDDLTPMAFSLSALSLYVYTLHSSPWKAAQYRLSRGRKLLPHVFLSLFRLFSKRFLFHTNPVTVFPSCMFPFRFSPVYATYVGIHSTRTHVVSPAHSIRGPAVSFVLTTRSALFLCRFHSTTLVYCASSGDGGISGHVTRMYHKAGRIGGTLKGQYMTSWTIPRMREEDSSDKLF